MTIMTWNASLDVGVDDMNREHQDILALMNQLHDLKEAGETGPKVTRLVQQLGEVTTNHFADEEAYMESIGYAGLSSHKFIHQDLLKKYGQYAQEIAAANGRMDNRFFSFLKLWLTAHIKGIDMKYSPNAATTLKKAS